MLRVVVADSIRKSQRSHHQVNGKQDTKPMPHSILFYTPVAITVVQAVDLVSRNTVCIFVSYVAPSVFDVYFSRGSTFPIDEGETGLRRSRSCGEQFGCLLLDS